MTLILSFFYVSLTFIDNIVITPTPQHESCLLDLVTLGPNSIKTGADPTVRNCNFSTTLASNTSLHLLSDSDTYASTITAPENETLKLVYYFTVKPLVFYDDQLTAITNGTVMTGNVPVVFSKLTSIIGLTSSIELRLTGTDTVTIQNTTLVNNDSIFNKNAIVVPNRVELCPGEYDDAFIAYTTYWYPYNIGNINATNLRIGDIGLSTLHYQNLTGYLYAGDSTLKI